MANTNNTSNVLNLFTGEPLAQRFIDDPELFALARDAECTWMTDAALADMDEAVDYREYLDQCKVLSAREFAALTEQMEQKYARR